MSIVGGGGVLLRELAPVGSDCRDAASTRASAAATEGREEADEDAEEEAVEEAEQVDDFRLGRAGLRDVRVAPVAAFPPLDADAEPLNRGDDDALLLLLLPSDLSADLLGVGASSVHPSLMRARRMLRRCMGLAPHCFASAASISLNMGASIFRMSASSSTPSASKASMKRTPYPRLIVSSHAWTGVFSRSGSDGGGDTDTSLPDIRDAVTRWQRRRRQRRAEALAKYGVALSSSILIGGVFLSPTASCSTPMNRTSREQV